jgi:hypothetical protein
VLVGSRRPVRLETDQFALPQKLRKALISLPFSSGINFAPNSRHGRVRSNTGNSAAPSFWPPISGGAPRIADPTLLMRERHRLRRQNLCAYPGQTIVAASAGSMAGESAPESARPDTVLDASLSSALVD